MVGIKSGKGTEETRPLYEAVTPLENLISFLLGSIASSLWSRRTSALSIKPLEIGDEATVRRIPEAADVVDIGSGRHQRPAQHLLELRLVEPRSDPIETLILCLGRVVFDRVLHRKGLGESISEAGAQPLLVVGNLPVLRILRLDEVLDHIDNKLRPEARRG